MTKTIRFLLNSLFIIALIIWIRKANKDKSKWGINLKRVHCPVCQTKQPIIRKPKNREELLWGGTTCPKCQTRLDKYGNVVPLVEDPNHSKA